MSPAIYLPGLAVDVVDDLEGALRLFGFPGPASPPSGPVGAASRPTSGSS